MAEAAHKQRLDAATGADGSDLEGIIILERDMQGDVCIAWSFPNPGVALEAALMEQASFTSQVLNTLSHIGNHWAYM
jgi:hypothetical protein